ncbi:MAG: ABC transporter substrate-binding protein, partial [Gammaproteobacteria bacterium]
MEDRAVKDNIPLIDTGGGRPEARNGLVFPYEFPLLTGYFSQGAVAVEYIAEQFGGYDKLAGKKIVTVYHDSGYGRASQPVMAALAKKYKFQNIQIPVAPPGEEQSAIWSKVRQIKPDFVVLRTWGVMTPVAIKTAKRYGIAINKMLGDIWAGSHTDMIPAGSAADGYCAIAPFPGGTNFGIHALLKKYILDKGESNLHNKDHFGWVYYNIGIIYAITTTEAMRAAMSKYGNHVLNGVQMQWGLEHINIDNARLKQLGMLGLLQPMHTSPEDHEGGGGARIQCWNGSKFHQVTGFIKGDTAVVNQVTETTSMAYAKEHGITVRTMKAAK